MKRSTILIDRTTIVTREISKSVAATFVPPDPFPERNEEIVFLNYYGRRLIGYRRTAIMFGLFLWTVFYGWDIHHFHTSPEIFSYQVLYEVTMFRTWGLAAICTCAIFSLSVEFEKDGYAHAVILCGIIVANICVAAMVAVVPSPLNYTYYFPGLYLILIYQFGFAHLRARPALRVSIFGMVLIILAQYLHKIGSPILFLDEPYFASGVFFYSCFCLIGFGINVKFEKYAREQYAHEMALIETNTLLRTKNNLIKAEQASSKYHLEALLRLKDEQRNTAIKASMGKSKFLADAAHDLRQPMVGISLSLEALSLSLHGGNIEEAVNFLKATQASVKVLVRSFNAILDLSRLESGLAKVKSDDFDIKLLIDEISTDFHQFATSNNVRLRLRLPDNVAVRSDRVLLGRTVKNLVANAIKYRRTENSNNPTVIIGIIRLPTHVRLDIIDNGIGIPPSQWTRIFDPFVQLENPDRKREKGLGLGLSIVNANISLLKSHRLEMKSGVGMGTRFSIEIPRGSSFIVFQNKPHQINEINSTQLAGVYAIIVEDDCVVRDALESICTAWGMLVDLARDISEFHQNMKNLERFPDLIITDYRLGDGKTAYEVLKVLDETIETNYNNRKIPVLLITAEGNAEHLSMKLGTSYYLAKPFNATALQAAILKTLHKRETI
jgi:signal transduction histidine kinase/CheY-like chemotaxis protein